jgi:hypothetical protein
MPVSITFGAGEKKTFDPAKALLKAIMPPAGMPAVNSDNWHQWVDKWEVEQAWWVPYLMDEANQCVSAMFWEFQKSEATEFALWVTDGLADCVKDGAFGNTPVLVASVIAAGPETQIVMQVGPYTLHILNWAANLTKKQSKKSAKSKPKIMTKAETAKTGLAVDPYGVLIEPMQDEGDALAPHSEQFGTDEQGHPTLILGGGD